MTACDYRQATAVRDTGSDSTLTVTGTIRGWDTGWVYIDRREKSFIYRRDSTRLQKGTFLYKTAVPGATHYSFSKGDDSFDAFLEPAQVTVTGHRDSLTTLRVSGSRAYDEARPIVQHLRDRHNMYDAYYSFVDSVTKAGTYNKYKDSLNRAVKRAAEAQFETYRAFIRKKPDSEAPVGYFFHYYTSRDSIQLIKRVYNSFGPNAKKSMSGQMIASLIRRMGRVELGQIAPNFSQKTPEGRFVSLRDYRGKYVLLDFWASWCGPCRADNPALVKVYHRFKGKNFALLGISLDERSDAWQRAIRKDKLNWTQVSDLKSFENEVAVLYVVESIPSTFLIDPTGKIIAKNLRGEDLTKKLAEVTK